MTHKIQGRPGGGALVARYPAVLFFVLTLTLSWGIWMLVLWFFPGVPTMLLVILGGFGPAGSAAIVTKVGGNSIRDWLQGILTFQQSIRWYVVAIALPVGISIAMLGLLVGITGRFNGSLVSVALLSFGINIVFATLLGGGQEEFGWRGFALPHLQEQFSAVTASLIIGVVWALWHVPLFVFDVAGYANLSLVYYAPAVVGLSIVFTCFYNSSRGELPATMLLHGTFNAAVNVPSILVGGIDETGVPIAGILALVIWIVALALLVRFGKGSLSTQQEVQTA